MEIHHSLYEGYRLRWQVQNNQEEKYPQQSSDFGGHLRNTNSVALVSQKIIKMIHGGMICIWKMFEIRISFIAGIQLPEVFVSAKSQSPYSYIIYSHLPINSKLLLNLPYPTRWFFKNLWEMKFWFYFRWENAILKMSQV